MLPKKVFDFFNRVGGFYRKPDNWAEVGQPVPPEMLADLVRYSSTQLGINYNLAADFKNPPAQTIFLVEHEGGLYVVRSEGYSYARYVRYVGSAKNGVGYKEYAAMQEGWVLSECDDGYFRIQKLDAVREFANDYQALTHVVMSANAGSQMHKVALGLHGTPVHPPNVVEGHFPHGDALRKAEQAYKPVCVRCGLPEDVHDDADHIGDFENK